MPATFSVPDRMPRSWPPPSIMRREQHARVAPPDVERADALRPAHLVRADGRHVHLQIVDVERNLADRLHGVGVEQDALLLRDRADLGDRLNHADLVVGGHDRDEDRLVGDGGRAARRG